MTTPIRGSIETSSSLAKPNGALHVHQTTLGVGSTLSSISSPTLRTPPTCFFLKNITRCIFSQVARFLIFALSPIAWIINRISPSLSTSSQSHADTQNATDHYPTHPILEGEKSHFSSLQITDADRKNIHYIITTLAGTNCLTLALYATTLIQKGGEIDNLHPLRFLECILQQRELVQGLHTMRTSLIKVQWNGFLDGTREKLERHAASLHQYFPGFAEAIKINQSHLDPFIQNQNWDEMLGFLIDVKLGITEIEYISPTPPSLVPSLSDAEETTVTKLLAKYAQFSAIRTATSERIGDLDQLWKQLQNTEITPLLHRLSNGVGRMDAEHLKRFQTALNRWITQRMTKEGVTLSKEAMTRIHTLASDGHWEALSILTTQHKRPLDDNSTS